MMRRDIRYLLAAVGAAFGLGFIGIERYAKAAKYARNPTPRREKQYAFIDRATRSHLKRFGNELVGEVYDHMDEDEPRRAA